ncbi:50S ribosomal protein L30 [Candidatus Woesearchaeota archaeon]|nr:50S ribosomal protein L30 [Candidatus Woesearchaeota archaeon]
MTTENKPKTEKKKHILAVVRVRGQVNLTYGLKRTFDLLNLHNKNWCVFVEDTPSIRGMIQKVKDYVTWGEVTDELMDEVISKRGELYKDRLEDSKAKIQYNKFIDHKGKKYNKFFRLTSPNKGYGRNGVKTSFANGGALGYRADKINELLERMI